MSESGNIIMPDKITDIWMSEPELVELFGITAPALRTAVRAIYKSGALKEYEVQKISDWKTAIMQMYSVSR